MIFKAVCAVCVVAAMATGCSRPALDRSGMTAGERLFRAKCRSCHVLPKPESMSDKGWAKFLEGHQGGSNLTKRNKESIAQYLSDNN